MALWLLWNTWFLAFLIYVMARWEISVLIILLFTSASILAKLHYAAPATGWRHRHRERSACFTQVSRAKPYDFHAYIPRLTPACIQPVEHSRLFGVFKNCGSIWYSEAGEACNVLTFNVFVCTWFLVYKNILLSHWNSWILLLPNLQNWGMMMHAF